MKYGGASQGAYNLLRCSGANGTHALQWSAVGTAGKAFDVSAAEGSKIRIVLSAAAKFRFSADSTVTTFSATDNAAFPGEPTAAPLLPADLYERDVPVLSDGEQKIWLIVGTVSGTVDVGIELA